MQAHLQWGSMRSLFSYCPRCTGILEWHRLACLSCYRCAPAAGVCLCLSCCASRPARRQNLPPNGCALTMSAKPQAARQAFCQLPCTHTRPALAEMSAEAPPETAGRLHWAGRALLNPERQGLPCFLGTLRGHRSYISHLRYAVREDGKISKPDTEAPKNPLRHHLTKHL